MCVLPSNLLKKNRIIYETILLERPCSMTEGNFVRGREKGQKQCQEKENREEYGKAIIFTDTLGEEMRLHSPSS